MKLLANKKVAWIALISWMLLIFFMSQQPGDESTKQSNFVIYIFNIIGVNLDKSLGDLASFVVRKAAHFSEYMILFFLSFNLLRHYINNKKIFFYGIAIVFAYACSDEFHQLFIDGRAGQFKDVLIDTSGGIFGTIVIFTLVKLKILKLKINI